MKWVKALLKLIGVLVAVLVLGAATLVALVRVEHVSEMTLPKPTGRFAVGRTSFIWTNDNLTDELAPSPGAKRTVFVWIWYPASATQGAAPADYLPPAWRSVQDDATATLM